MKLTDSINFISNYILILSIIFYLVGTLRMYMILFAQLKFKKFA